MTTPEQKRAGSRMKKLSTKLSDSVHGKFLEVAISSPTPRPSPSTTSASSSSKGKVATNKIDKLEEMVSNQVRDLNVRLNEEVAMLKDLIIEKCSGMAGNISDTSATDSEVENKVKLLENKIDTMSKTFENKFEGLSELVKKFIDNNSSSDVSAIVNSDGNEGAVNNTSAAFNRIDIIENNLGSVVDDVTSIKDTLATLNQSINQVQKTYANAVTSTSVAGRQHQYGPALPDQASDFRRYQQLQQQRRTGNIQGQGTAQAGVQQQYIGRNGNQHEEFLNRLRQDKARFMIVFGVKEEEYEGIEEMEQKVVDRYTVNTILEDMKQKNLSSRVVSTQRLGSKNEGRIRPIRVEFDSVMSRETACRNARELIHSERYRNMVSISRDKTREDRERDRVKYLAYK